MKLGSLFVALFAPTPQAAAVPEGTCATLDLGFQWLQNKLSSSSLISCKDSPGQQDNAGSYWELQFSKNASVVVFPATTQDISYTIKATQLTPLGKDYAFVFGVHYIRKRPLNLPKLRLASM
jgi:hypothetical protein